MLLTKFDIQYITQNSIKGSILVDHLASLSVTNNSGINDGFQNKEIAVVPNLSSWHMYFDDVANHFGFGLAVILISSHGDHILKAIHLDFSYRYLATNNIVEYEACILGLEITLELKIRVILGLYLGD